MLYDKLAQSMSKILLPALVALTSSLANLSGANIQTTGSTSAFPATSGNICPKAGCFSESAFGGGPSNSVSGGASDSGQNGTYSVSYLMNGRAAYGNLAASWQASASQQDNVHTGAMPGGYVVSVFSDLIDYSVVGTGAYFSADVSVGGSGMIQGAGYWSAVSTFDFGSAHYAYSRACNNVNTPAPEQCSTTADIGPQSLIPNGLQPIVVPLQSILTSGNRFSLAGRLDVGGLVQLSGPLPASAATSVDYAHTARIGGFRILDANFKDLGATWTSESGYDYSAALANDVPKPSTAPEPSTLTLFAAGTAALGLRRLRKNFHPCQRRNKTQTRVGKS